MNRCNIISYLEKYGNYINRLVSFVYPDQNPEYCNYTIKQRSRIETRCHNTVMSILFALFGDFRTNIYTSNNADTIIHHAFNKLDDIGFIILQIPKDDKGFPGHILAIIKERTDQYCIMQSYIFEYEIFLCRATRLTLLHYIDNYCKIFNGTPTWTKTDADLWKKITNVDISNIIGNEKIHSVNIMLPRPILSVELGIKIMPSNALHGSCMIHLNSLLDKSLNKLNDIDQALNLFEIKNSTQNVMIKTIKQALNLFRFKKPTQKNINKMINSFIDPKNEINKAISLIEELDVFDDIYISDDYDYKDEIEFVDFLIVEIRKQIYEMKLYLNMSFITKNQCHIDSNGYLNISPYYTFFKSYADTYLNTLPKTILPTISRLPLINQIQQI